jgi:sarcosine oxidase gamma subunit
VFEFAVFRSLAGSFWHALSLSAAEFGLRLHTPG